MINKLVAINPISPIAINWSFKKVIMLAITWGISSKVWIYNGKKSLWIFTADCFKGNKVFIISKYH